MMVLVVLAPALPSASIARADDIDQIRLAARQLAGSQLSSGMLDFDFDFVTGRGSGLGSSDGERSAYIAREAGTTYLLAKYLTWSKDTSSAPVIRRLITILASLSLPVSKSVNQQLLEHARILSVPFGRSKLQSALGYWGLLYRPNGQGRLLSYESSYKAAWVGSTALALLAEMEYFRATGDGQFAEIRLAWVEGLRTLHVPGRGFREYPASLDEAAYGNGEAWLALANYAALFPGDERVRELLANYDDYVMETYSNAPNRQFFSWGAMSAAVRLGSTSDRKFELFIAEQARHFVDLELPAAERSDNSCAFVEGLATAASVLGKRDGYGDLSQKLISRIEVEMRRNRGLQIPLGASELDFVSGASFRSPRLADHAGAYLMAPGNLYTRIDLTAHCLSALVEMQSIAKAH